MADELDLAQQHEDMHRAHAIAAITRPRPPGRTECRTCGEPITPLRTELGAQLCIDCQSEAEQKAKGGRP